MSTSAVVFWSSVSEAENASAAATTEATSCFVTAAVAASLVEAVLPELDPLQAVVSTTAEAIRAPARRRGNGWCADSFVFT